MDRPGHIKAMNSEDAFEAAHSRGSCPECAERSSLRVLVAELLYKNQILRFELRFAEEQLNKAAFPLDLGD